MIRRVFFLLIALVLISYALSAQQLCSTDEKHNEKMRDANYKAKYEEYNTTLSRNAVVRRSSRTLASGAVYTIPVVIHVMHKGEPVGSGVNISDEKIYGTIKELNERFRNVPGSPGEGNSVDMEYQFALAVRDPNGNCTNGINRVNMSGYQNYMDYGNSSLGMDEATLKSISFWDARYYCNIWIISAASEGFGGYSSFPHQHGSSSDGIVIRYDIIGIDPSYQAMTHELGHYVGLEHVFHWGNSETCPPNNNCLNQGDGVCDTPPQLMGAPCEPTPNPCDNGEVLAATNYMSYSCMSEFTQGQKERSRIAFDFYRTSLLEENGNMALVSPGSFTANFITATEGACMTFGSDIQFFDRTTCLPNTFIDAPENVSFNWTVTGNNGEVLTSTDRNPVFTIPEAGSYDVTLAVTTPNGTNTTTKNNFLVAGGTKPATTCFVRTLGATRAGFDGIGIYEVILGNMHHSSGSVIEDVRNAVTDRNGYGDFSCTYSASLEPYTGYTISVKLAEFYQESVYVYIDFDNNGITNDDLVTFSDVPRGSGLFALPPFTTPGFPIFNTPLRMRVIDVESSEPPPSEPCDDVGYYGQVQDYAVIFNNVFPLANDDAITIDEDDVAFIDVAVNDIDLDGTIKTGTVDLDPATEGFQFMVITEEGIWNIGARNEVRFRPALNFNGIAKIQYTISDNRYAQSLPATIMVNVNPVNDAPAFVKGVDQVVMEDQGAQAVANWATGISAGPADESSQVLTFNVANDNNGLFAAQPSINTNGDLTYTPSPDASGIAIVSVVLKDNGGTDHGGVDLSITQTFTITVNPVNDAPSFTKGSDQIVDEDAGAQMVNGWATSISAGPMDEASQTLTFDLTNDNNGLFSEQPSINVNGDLRYTPAASIAGSVMVTVVLKDDGGTGNGGIDAVTETFMITINSVNDPPILTNVSFTTDEDIGITGNILHASDHDPEGTLLVINTIPVIGPAHGIIGINNDGSFVFMPSPDFFGSDAATISVCDSGDPASCSVKTIGFIINPVNDAPTVGDYTTVTAKGVSIYGNFSTGDSDVDGTISYKTTPVSGPDHGNIVINPDGTFTYTPDEDYTGSDIVVIEACDDGTPIMCVEKHLRIEIQQNAGTSPVAVNDEITVTQDEEIMIDLLANDIDEDNDIDPASVDLDVSASGIQQSVSLDGTGIGKVTDDGVLSFFTAADFSGIVELSYAIKDSQGNLSNTATIRITIDPVLPQGVTIPNGFTPNGDGQNDLFEMEGIGQYRVRLSVYNRWGNVVFEDPNYRNTWNGTYRNETKVPDGTYFYTVELTGSGAKRYRGFIEIRR